VSNWEDIERTSAIPFLEDTCEMEAMVLFHRGQCEGHLSMATMSERAVSPSLWCWPG
jgi:hypothetical protein